MDQLRIYEIIYALAARGGREAALFGDCGAIAREAFARSLASETFPELWFEIPLTGEPWLDLHVLVSQEDVAGTNASFTGQGGPYAAALSWFADQKPHEARQLALSYDTSEKDVEHPAVQLLVGRRDPATSLAFLNAVGRSDATSSYQIFAQSMPEEWFACYVGAFPRRNTPDDDRWVRVECIVGDDSQRSYANDAAVLREHLSRVGLDGVDANAIDAIQTLARSSFPLELQFNVGANGAAPPIVSASLRFQPDDWTDESRRESIYSLMRQLQDWGLADERCEQLEGALFCKRISRNGAHSTLSCIPTFVKLRWRKGAPLDAKAYLVAHSR